MQDSKVYAQLTEIFRDLFDDDSLEIRLDTTPKDIEAWDSFNHINLIVAVEGRFGIRFSTTEIESLQNVGSRATLIESKLAAK